MGITKLLIVKAKEEKKGVENELLPVFIFKKTHNWRPRIDIDGGGPLYIFLLFYTKKQ